MRIKQTAQCLGIGPTVGWLAVVVTLAASPARDQPRPDDDWTFRPTVIIRKGNSQGSGSVIASVRGETLILTAAHVVEDRGPLKVELHRYNVGLERDRAGVGTSWPRSLPAEVVAADVAADVAIIRVKGLPQLPYVARLAVQGAEPARGTTVTSLGIDLGSRLSSWVTRIAEVDRFEIEGTGAERLFLITAKPPEHGRSGGGLFLANGDLIGVCVGRARFVRGRSSGIFASSSSIRRLLQAHNLDDRIGTAPATASATPRQRPPITTTQARPPR